LLESLFDPHYPQLLVGHTVDHTYFARADAFVDADVL
jgi:hypothetical protein